jgi:5-methylcytosine-specific restriction endonuclease McrA
MSTALHSLSDRDLLSSTKSVVTRERGVTIEVLDHLSEVERRKLYLTLAHSSMFAYCTDELGYSTSAAKRRITTARCVARFPEALPLLKTNEINLSTITQISRVINPRNSRALLERIRNKTQREVESILAEYEPLEALPRERARTVVVRVPMKPSPIPPRPSDTATTSLSPDSTVAVGILAQDRNGPEAESAVASAPAVQLEKRVVKQFCAREVVMNKIASVQALASHRLPMNAPFEEVIEFLADYFLQREDPKARHERREKKAAAKPETSPKISSPRAVPAPVRDEVFVRDGGSCSYVGADGKRCGSTHVLQIDHVQPVARGGSASVGNLRLLCAYHNRLEAERLMGPVAARSGP